MATLNWPGFGLASISPTFDQPSQSNSSAWTGTRTVIANPWHGKWSFRVALATVQGDGAFQAARAFFTNLKGQINTFHLPAVEAPQNANTGVTLSANAAQGATSIALTGVTTALVAGNMVTIAGQLLSLTSVGSLSGSAQTVNFMPSLRAAASSGASVETARPYALVYLADSKFTWDIGSWRRYGLTFDATEAVGETDGASPSLDIWTGGTGGSGGGGTTFTFPQLTSFISRSVLAAVTSPTDKQVAYLTEAGREGTFVFSTANLSTNVTGDTQQGIYVPPSSDTSGASGAWVRKFDGPVSVKWFGAKGDNTTDDTTAIQAAANSFGAAGGTLFFPPGRYKITAYIALPANVRAKGVHNEASVIVSAHAGGGGANAFENLRNGSTFASIHTINSSTGVNQVVEDLGIENSNSVNQGAGFFDRGGTFITLERVRVQGHRFGGCYAQSELVTRISCRFESQVNNGAGEWFINGNDLGDSESGSFTNDQLSLLCQYNEPGTIPCLVHDGGSNYTSINDNLNGGTHAFRLAGINNFFILNMAAESQSAEPVTLNATSYYASAGVGSCSGAWAGGGISGTSGTYGCIKAFSAGTISIGGGIVLATPQGTPGASIQGTANIFSLEIGSVSVSYEAAGDTTIDGWATRTHRPAHYAANAPGSGYYRAGQVVLNNGPSVGALYGWRCVTSGSPGTWEALYLPDLATTVASLPAAGNAGRRALATDASATTFNSIVAGGGANKVPVYDDGTNWRIG